MLDSVGKPVTLAEAPMPPRSVVKGSGGFANPSLLSGEDDEEVEANFGKQDELGDLVNFGNNRDEIRGSSSSSSSATSYGAFKPQDFNGSKNP